MTKVGAGIMAHKQLPPNIWIALDRLRQLGRPAGWTEFACIPGRHGKDINVMRHLHRHGYVEDITQPYRPGETWEGPRLPRYRLTDRGMRALYENRHVPSED